MRFLVIFLYSGDAPRRERAMGSYFTEELGEEQGQGLPEPVCPGLHPVVILFVQ